MKSQAIKKKHEKALVTKEITLSNLGKNIFIGDSAATSLMTSNKMGVYNLTPIKGSVIIGNGQSIFCTHKGSLGCDLPNIRMGSHGKGKHAM